MHNRFITDQFERLDKLRVVFPIRMSVQVSTWLSAITFDINIGRHTNLIY